VGGGSRGANNVQQTRRRDKATAPGSEVVGRHCARPTGELERGSELWQIPPSTLAPRTRCPQGPGCVAIPLAVDLSINRQRLRQRYRHACIAGLNGKKQPKTRDLDDHYPERSNHRLSDQSISILDQQTCHSPVNDMGPNLHERSGSTFEHAFKELVRHAIANYNARLFSRTPYSLFMVRIMDLSHAKIRRIKS